MTSSNTLLKKIIGVKDIVVTDAEIYSDHDGVTQLTIDARLNSWNRNKCPFCGRKRLPVCQWGRVQVTHVTAERVPTDTWFIS